MVKQGLGVGFPFMNGDQYEKPEGVPNYSRYHSISEGSARGQ